MRRHCQHKKLHPSPQRDDEPMQYWSNSHEPMHSMSEQSNNHYRNPGFIKIGKKAGVLQVADKRSNQYGEHGNHLSQVFSILVINNI